MQLELGLLLLLLLFESELDVEAELELVSEELVDSELDELSSDVELKPKKCNNSEMALPFYFYIKTQSR